jgi:MFS transporter, ACS family, allantoate permease
MDRKDNPPAPQELAEIENVDVITDDAVKSFNKYDDEAMKAFAEFDGEPLVLDEPTKRRLLRTIDWHLMPVL